MVKLISDHIANIFGVMSFLLMLAGATLRNCIIIGVCIFTFLLFILAHIYDDFKLRRSFNELKQNQKNIDDITKKLKQAEKDLEESNNVKNNINELYQSTRKEIDQYSDEQSELRELSSKKNRTFAFFIFRELEVSDSPEKTIKLLHEFKLDPGKESELINFGLGAVEENVKTRKEIDALEIENNGGNLDES